MTKSQGKPQAHKNSAGQEPYALSIDLPRLDQVQAAQLGSRELRLKVPSPLSLSLSWQRPVKAVWNMLTGDGGSMRTVEPPSRFP